MNNAEKYKTKLKNIGYPFGVHRGEPFNCMEGDCKHCDFSKTSATCDKNRFDWLTGEAVDTVLEKLYKHINEECNKRDHCVGCMFSYVPDGGEVMLCDIVEGDYVKREI